MAFERHTALTVTDPQRVAMIARALRKQGSPVVLVPLLGVGLHGGHLALIRAARRIPGAITIVAAPEGSDIHERLAQEKVDVHYAYNLSQLWPEGPRSLLAVADRGLGDPGILAREVSVLLTLMNVVGPSDLIVGEKDYEVAVTLQQVITDWHVPVKLHSVPAVRTAEGVPLSLSASDITGPDREAMVTLSAALTAGAHAAEQGGAAVTELVTSILVGAGLDVAFVSVRSPGLGEPPDQGDGRLLAGIRLRTGAVASDSVGLPLGIGFKNLE